MSTSFAQAYQNAKSEVAQFNTKHDTNKTPFGAAGTAASKSLDEFNKANVAFKSGDALGGSAAVLRGIGALSAALVLGGGPAGAAFGLVLGVILGVISSILEAMKPATASLIGQIEKLLDEQTLKETRQRIKGGLDAWELEEKKIDHIVRTGRPFTQADYDGIGWKHHYEQIESSFAALQDNKGVDSKQWLLLFDLNVIYALRFWTYVELTFLLVNQQGRPGPESHELRKVESSDLKRSLYDMRNSAAKKFRDNIKSLYYHSRNGVDFHALYRTSGYAPYVPGKGQYGWQRNAIYHRVGVVEGPPMKNLGSGESLGFAVASSGTIFSVGSRPYTLYVGRGSDWRAVSRDVFGDDVEQVAIAEWGDDKVSVVCLHGSGRKISFCMFNDETPIERDGKYKKWATGDWRWGKWFHYSTPNQMTILSLAVQVKKPDWSIYAIALDSSSNGELYKVTWGPDQNEVNMEGFPATQFDKRSLDEMTYGVTPAPGRVEISPCTVTCLGDDLYAQVGNQVWHRINTIWDGWNARTIIRSDVNVYQARFLADGTQLFSTNKGLYMRYLDPENDWKYSLFRDEAIDTVWFWKAVSSQAVTAEDLLKEVTKAAEQPF